MTSSEQADDLAGAKREARVKAETVRTLAHRQAGAQAAAALADTGLSFLKKKPGTVSGFIPYRSEIDLMPLLQRLADENVATCLPVVKGKDQPLEFRNWAPGDPTVAGAWDIPVPLESAGVVDPDVLLVPMLAFDPCGYRLGYGGGFYDRTLARLQSAGRPLAVGVAYAGQEMPALPQGPGDRTLDWILTEGETIAIGGEGHAAAVLR